MHLLFRPALWIALMLGASACKSPQVTPTDTGTEPTDPVDPTDPPNPTDPPPPTPDCEFPTALGVPLAPTGQLVLPYDGTGTLQVSDGFELDGASQASLPGQPVLVASQPGQGTLDIQVDGCPATTIALTATRDPGLSARLLADDPGFTSSDAFASGSVVRAALLPDRFPQLQGTVDVYRVPHGATVLDDVGGAPTTVTIDGPTLVDLGTIDTPPSTVVHEDLVVDVDRDGVLSIGDLRDGHAVPGLSGWPDLSEPGPHVTEEAIGSYGGVFQDQRVFWPTGLDAFDGPRPLVVISHGNGHQYDWYGPLQDQLASWGYIVMSHSSDTEPGIAAATATLIDNTEQFLANPGQIHPDLVGHVDPDAVIWIGHSRGGEAVAMGARQLADGTATPAQFSYDSLKLIVGIAPSVLTSPQEANPGDRPFHLVLGGADGDITQGPIAVPLPFRCGYCKSSRLLQGNTGPQGVHYLQGAAHNDFNCCGLNDAIGVNAPRIGRPAATTYAKALFTALLQHRIEGHPHAEQVLAQLGEHSLLPDTGQPVSILTMPPRDGARFVEDFQTEPDGNIASSGGAVVHDLPAYTEGAFRDGNILYAYNPDDPMNGMTQSEGEPGIAAMGAVFTFTDDVSWEVALTEPLQVQDRMLAVRVAQSTRHPETMALDDVLHFSIALVQPDGVTSLRTEPYGVIPAPYARPGAGDGVGWAAEFNTVRIPLTDFEQAGADLDAVTGIRLSFGPSHGSPRGRVAFDDLVLEP